MKALAKHLKKVSKKEQDTIIKLKEAGWSDAVIAKVLNAKGEKGCSIENLVAMETKFSIEIQIIYKSFTLQGNYDVFMEEDLK